MPRNKEAFCLFLLNDNLKITLFLQDEFMKGEVVESVSGKNELLKC